MHSDIRASRRFSASLLVNCMLTLSLYPASMLLQLRMEGSRSLGKVRTLVTFSVADGAMGSPTSLRRSVVATFLLPLARKTCLLYKQYLGLISREELFSMQAETFNFSPATQTINASVKITLSMTLTGVRITLSYYLGSNLFCQYPHPWLLFLS